MTGARAGEARAGITAALISVVALVAALGIGAQSVAAADPPFTGFIVDSEAGSPVGGGLVHDHFPSALIATGSTADFTITGGGWEFGFEWTQPITAGSYFDGKSQFRVRKDGSFCQSSDWTYQVFEAPEVLDGAVTRFAADFYRRGCGGAQLASMYGSIRIGSDVPVSMLHVTSDVTFPDTVVGSTSIEHTVELVNVGDTAITVGPASAVAGQNPADFALTDPCGVTELDPGQECSLAVTFSPLTTTDRSASIDIPTTGYGPSRTVDLSGYGLSPIVGTPSALIISGPPGPFAGGDHWLDPVLMTATGNDHDLRIQADDWSIRLATSDASPFTAATYADVDATTANGHHMLTVRRDGQSCSEPIDGSFTVLEPPVIDTDGTILRFAADFTYTCPQLGASTLRGWIRYHSDAARPVEEPVTYAIEVDGGSTVQVGESITLTPRVTGVDLEPAHRCQMAIQSQDPVQFVRMRVASDGCEPWTLTVPPSAAGTYIVSGRLLYGDAGSQTVLFADDVPLEIAAGSAVPFETNYPVQSWAAADLLSDPTPAFGQALTLRVPDGLDACRASIFAGLANVITHQGTGCSEWTLSVPAPSPDTVTSFFEDRSDAHILGWVGESEWAEADIEVGDQGERFGETYNAALPRFVGTSVATFTSDLPAIFTGDARGNVYYADDPSTHAFSPVVVGVTTGSCTSDRPPFTQPVSTAGCAAFQVPPTQFTGNVHEGITFRLLSASGVLLAESTTGIGFVDRMTPLEIDTPGSTPVGTPLPIETSTGSGAPGAYLIQVTPVGSGTVAGDVATVAALPATKSYAGSFTPGAGAGGASVSIQATGLVAGTWDVSARFTDVLGATVTATKRVTIVAPDTTPPAGSIAIAGGAAYSKTAALTVSVAASDGGSGLAKVALSNDGTNWTTRTYGASQSWALPATNGTRRVYAKWQDKAGNWSAVKSDTIVLDTVAPTATVPRRGFVGATTIAANAITTRIPWSGADATSGIARYELQHQVGTGAWVTVSTTLTSPTANRALATEQTHRFRVRAVDKAGNAGAWVTGDTFRVSRFSEGNSRVTYSGTWALSKSSAFWGGQAKAASRLGARATIRFTGRSVAWVASTGPTRGKAEVYVNGARVATVDLYAAAGVHQRVVWVGSYSTAVARTISIRVLGTSGRPRVDMDAFVTAN